MPTKTKLKYTQPIGDRILLSELPVAETKNGIYIPTASQTKYWSVVALGTGIPIIDSGAYIMPPFTVGDKVIINPGAGVPVTHNEKKYLVVNSGDVLLKLEGK